DIDASEPFTLPIEPFSWMSVEYTSQQLREIANTYIARFLVYSARTPEEREDVNWQKVLDATAQGLTFDFNLTLGSSPGVGSSAHLSRIQHNNQGYHAHYRWIGAADTSGAYQAWLAMPLEDRNR